jgi:hypothetical protein
LVVTSRDGSQSCKPVPAEIDGLEGTWHRVNKKKIIRDEAANCLNNYVGLHVSFNVSQLGIPSYGGICSRIEKYGLLYGTVEQWWNNS